MQTFKSLMAETLKQYFRNFPAVLLIVLPVALPVEWIKNYFFLDPYESLWATMRRDGFVDLIFLSIITPVAILYFYGKAKGEAVSVSRILRQSFRRWPRFIIYNFAKNVILTAGLILLVVPGILFFARLFLVDTVIALESRDYNPLHRSWKLSKGNVLPIIASAFVLFCIVQLPAVLMSFPLYLVLDIVWSAGYWLGDLLLDLYLDLGKVLFLILGLNLYMRLTGSQTREAEAGAVLPEVPAEEAPSLS